MKLYELIQRLKKLEDMRGGNIDVSVITEGHTVGKHGTIQLEALVTDTAFSSRTGVYIIGKELSMSEIQGGAN